MAPPLTKAQLEAVVRGDDRYLSDTASDVIREFDRLFNNYIARVRVLTTELPTDERTIRALADRTVVMERLRNELEEAGLFGFTEKYGETFTEVTEQALDYFSRFDLPRSLAGASAEQLEFLINNNISELYERLDESLVRPLQSAIVQGVIGDRPTSVIAENIDTSIAGISQIQMQRLIDDSYSRYHRQVRQTKAAEVGMDVVWYKGPDDKITSEQCQFLLGYSNHGVPGMFFRKEVHAGLHPALREDPLVVGGHYNCRHHWVPLLLEDAKRYGFRP